jgi:PAS domain S-box-containing protein
MVMKSNVEKQKAESDALFASIGDGALSINEEGKISRVNQVAADILGFSEEELIGKWFPGTIIAQDERGEVIEPNNRPVFRSFVEGKAISQKLRYITKDGNSVPVAVTVSPIILDDKPVGAIEVFRDITREQEVDRMKSEFISIASHQLRTPLSAIQTYANLLASGFRGDITPDQRELMDIILSSVDRMNDLITTLLDISRIETGKLSIQRGPVNLDELCKTIIQELESVASNKKVALTYECQLKPQLVQTDQLLVAEAYANLISNAVKYTAAKGSVKVTLRRDSKDTIIFCVTDNGLGIPRKMQGQIFTKFFRASNVLEYDTTGTGLGLYMVKQIADALKGKTWFKSQEGKGTTFYFALPAE